MRRGVTSSFYGFIGPVFWWHLRCAAGPWPRLVAHRLATWPRCRCSRARGGSGGGVEDYSRRGFRAASPTQALVQALATGERVGRFDPHGRAWSCARGKRLPAAGGGRPTTAQREREPAPPLPGRLVVASGPALGWLVSDAIAGGVSRLRAESGLALLRQGYGLAHRAAAGPIARPLAERLLLGNAGRTSRRGVDRCACAGGQAPGGAR